MTAAFAVQDTGPGWRTVAAVVALGILALAVLARREVVRERQAQRELKALRLRKQMAANARAHTLCTVIVPAGCTEVATTAIAGFKMCAAHAAPFLGHAADRDTLLDLETEWLMDGQHGVAHLEALANGLVDL